MIVWECKIGEWEFWYCGRMAETDVFCGISWHRSGFCHMHFPNEGAVGNTVLGVAVGFF